MTVTGKEEAAGEREGGEGGARAVVT